MFKKVFAVILITTALVLLALWSPWANWNVSILGLLGLQNKDDKAGLQVYSTNGEISVKIDDTVVGHVTPEGSPLDVTSVTPGDHLVNITRVTDANNKEAVYYEFTQMIRFVKGINTVIAYEIGPSSRYSNGYTIYASKGINSQDSYMNIRTDPDKAKVYINDLEIGNAPVTNYKLDLKKDYKIKIVMDNYENMEFSLLPESKDERKLIKGYDLNVDVKLFELPLEVRNSTSQ